MGIFCNKYFLLLFGLLSVSILNVAEAKAPATLVSNAYDGSLARNYINQNFPNIPVKVSQLQASGKLNVYQQAKDGSWTLNGKPVNASEVPNNGSPALIMPDGSKIESSGNNFLGLPKDPQGDLKRMEQGLDKIGAQDQSQPKPATPTTVCTFFTPGLTQDEFIPPKTAGVETNGIAAGYGNRLPKMPESPVNKALRAKADTTAEKRWEELMATTQTALNAGQVKRVVVYLPDSNQAMEYATSGKYTVHGVPITPGDKFNPSPEKNTNGLTFDENCNPTQGAAPATPGSPANPFQGLQGPGSGVPGSPGAPGLGGLGGGLGALLPLLMSGMLGGGQNQGNQNGQNGYGAGNGTNTTTNCQAYGVVPVCGSDGTKTTTYTNSCWEQQLGATQVSAGVCPTSSPTPTPQPTPDVAKIVSELVNSGVPSSILTSIINSLSSLINHINSGETLVQ